MRSPPAQVTLPSAGPAALLARLEFQREAAADGEALRFPLQLLGGHAAEDWLGGGGAEILPGGPGLQLRRSGDYLFGLLSVPAAQSVDMERAAFLAYGHLLRLLQERGYPHPLRIWNYFHEVTGGDGDDERYRRFCVGRHEAIAAPGFESRLPAATVIGTFVPGLQLGFLAGKRPGIPVENPRQVSAYHYPREYSPRAPSFARATLLDRLLLVSGTASVVGHATQHPYDAPAQLRETVDNIGALLAHARQQHFAEEPALRWQPRALRLYVRDAAQAAALQAQAEALLGGPLMVLHGEICRRDLEVEIEGVFEAISR
ncbi:pteridine-dependent deoxygenase [Solimonas fluminis]|uniref:Pteridine-dependent deoxygenase n=1 Tax=Solimonas fluminis TaxID=2086571 RepID=A0A2S5TJ50_9GAMM|nr:pteridine-dependent deoxygenase [Solimonas fluminis]PPE75013.1 pteridine-dependent deoxygenase [Solimonas fluminis]